MDQVSFRIDKGDKIGLVGRNGAVTERWIRAPPSWQPQPRGIRRNFRPASPIRSRLVHWPAHTPSQKTRPPPLTCKPSPRTSYRPRSVSCHSARAPVCACSPHWNPSSCRSLRHRASPRSTISAAAPSNFRPGGTSGELSTPGKTWNERATRRPRRADLGQHFAEVQGRRAGQDTRVVAPFKRAHHAAASVYVCHVEHQVRQRTKIFDFEPQRAHRVDRGGHRNRR